MTYKILNTDKKPNKVCPCGKKHGNAMNKFCSNQCKLKYSSGRVDNLDELESLSNQVLYKMARGYFQAWVKKRDKNQPCITGNHPFKKSDEIHAGHVLSCEQFKGLALDEDNCFAQCKTHNYDMGNPVTLHHTAETVRARLGEDKFNGLVARMKSTPRDYKWSRPELIEIIKKYAGE